MTGSQIPSDLENQLAGPGGQFPGTAETLATPVGSDKPVRVKIGQADNRHLQLSREEYRARSARQREIDAQTDTTTDPTQDPQLGTNPSAAAKNALTSNAVPPKPPRKNKPHRPRKRKSGPNPVGDQQEKLIGQPYPAPSTTAAPIPIPTDAMMEQRMSRMERGMDMIVRAISERDERAEAPQTQFTPSEEDCRLAGLPQDPDFDDEDDDEPDDDSDKPEPYVAGDVDVEDEPPLHVAGAQVELAPELDKGLQELQQMILKRNPLKRFRQFWCQQSRAAQYNEWPPERREAFDEVFNSMVAHPKFIHQMSTFLRGSRSGNCIGNEQIARVCGMVAGFLTVYQLAAAGR